MKAIIYNKVGGPEVLEYATVKDPSVASDQALVSVKACGINLLDYYLRIEEDVEMPLPHIMGSDVAGVVVSLGKQAKTSCKVGDEVIVSAAIENYKPGRAGIIGYQINGGYAELVAVPAANLIKKPSGISFIESAALPLASQTVYHQMIVRGHLKAGETVLIIGANSGIGCFGKSIADAIGAKSVCTVSSPAKLARANALGWSAVVNHNDADWEQQVLALTNNEGVDVVVDHMGGKFTEAAIRACKAFGRVVCIGSTQGDEIKVKLSELYRKQLSLIGSYMGTVEDLKCVVDLVDKAKVKPVIDKVFALTDAAEAHRYLENRQHFGKIVLKVG